MEITQNLLDVSPYNRSGIALGNVTAIAVHYVGNAGSTAINNRNYFNNLATTHTTKASSHYIVGLEGEIIQCIPESELSYCTSQGNTYTISVETCHPDNTGKFSSVTYASLVWLCADICKRHSLNPTGGGLLRHYDVTGKICPKWFVDYPGEWDKFKQNVRAQMAGEKITLPDNTTPVKPETSPSGKPFLINGSKGDSVKELQEKLARLGYSVGNTGVDGIFGSATLAAVKAFQEDSRITVDGKVGDKTWAALDGKAAATAIACPYKEPVDNVKKGSKGDDVRWVQWQLKNKGYSVGATGIDGICGVNTVAAVTKFQKDKGLAVDSIVGVKTREKLRS